MFWKYLPTRWRIARPSPRQAPAARLRPCLEVPESRIAPTTFVDRRNLTGVTNGSATRPCTSIQAAVSAAPANDTINVAMGTYTENVTITDKGQTLQGGFVGGSSTSYAAGQPGDFAVSNPAVNVTRI